MFGNGIKEVEVLVDQRQMKSPRAPEEDKYAIEVFFRESWGV